MRVMHHPMLFRVVDTIPEDEWKILFDWGHNIWGDPSGNLQCRPVEVHIIGYVGDRAATHIGLTRQEVVVGSERVVVGGVGGVVTALEHQRKGYSKASLEEAARYMKSKMGVDFGLLFCLEKLVPHYSSVGYRRVNESVTVNQPGGRVKVPSVTMYLEFDRPWPVGAVDIDSLPW